MPSISSHMHLLSCFVATKSSFCTFLFTYYITDNKQPVKFVLRKKKIKIFDLLHSLVSQLGNLTNCNFFKTSLNLTKKTQFLLTAFVYVGLRVKNNWGRLGLGWSFELLGFYKLLFIIQYFLCANFYLVFQKVFNCYLQ